MPSLLFIAPPDLGETVLATGALAAAMESMGAPRVTIMCDAAMAGLFTDLPGLAAVKPWDGARPFEAWMQLAAGAFGAPFDLVLDLRPSPASLIVAAKRRIARQPPQHSQHLARSFGALAGAADAEPKLWFGQDARARAGAMVPGPAPILAIAPGGVGEAKRWPAERFAAAARRLAGGPLSGARILIFAAAARDRRVTRAIAQSLDADGVAARDLGAENDIALSAALLERATLCLGNDNALTHIAAAAGAPTLTLFGPTDERVRAPLGARARTLRGMAFEAAASLSAPDAHAAMDALSIDAVEAAARDVLHAGGLQ